MTATTRRRLAVPRRPRAACLLGSVLTAAALLWLPIRQAGADAESLAAEAVQPAAAESVAVDSSTVVASLEAGAIDSTAVQAGAVDADTLAAATRGVGFRPSFPARGLRLDGSTGILREVDRQWRLKTFFADVAPSRAEPEREGSE